ncbi:unnamed protein product [Caenorhabditis auriculariae]|uniref:Carboxylic ester hydrolase n=1 Tax=Caenorhabditis auriculariae TaxID=2777116 RepID=A0A8S1GTH4_9PELO|nr:unnamed protein product [Caenorhabditis auriculariae]
MFALLFLSFCLLASCEKPFIATNFGPIVGFQHKSPSSDDVFNVFLGIRYARPPDHIFRFQKPDPVEKWGPVQHDATHFRASCIPSLRSELEDDVNYSEDCLFLNIVTPNNYKGRKLPVLMFVHGGGFQYGNAMEFGYEKAAEHFVSQDIIFVSVQYRLGPLGFFTTGDGEIPGNMGLWDLTTALYFLHEVLPDFGGDPEKITVAGQSAGSAAVSALLYSPHSDHLFLQAIQMSGSIFAENSISENVVEDSKALAKAAGCSETESKALRACMEERTIDEILDAMEQIGELLPGPRNKKFHPRMDNDYFPYDLEKMSRKAPKKRTMQGLLSLESGNAVCYPTKLWKLLGVPKESWGSYGRENFEDFIRDQVAVEKDFGRKTSAFYQLVRDFYLRGVSTNANSSAYLRAYAELLGDLQYGIPSLHEIDLKRQHDWPTFFYVIDYESETTRDPAHPIRGAFHASELRFLFNFRGLERIPFDENDKLFERHLVNAFANFVKTGDPSTTEFVWTPISNEQPFLNALLNPHPKLEDSFRRDAYDLWQTEIPRVTGAELLKKRLPAARATFQHTEL